MRYEAFEHLAHSAIHSCRFFLQEVVDDKDLQSLHQHAQQGGAHPNLQGCVDSPEAATFILLLVGVADLYLGSRWMQRRHKISVSGSLTLKGKDI